MILMKLRVLALAATLALALGACTATDTPPGTLSVVVGLYPYAWLAEQLGGQYVTVTNLTKPGAEPHDMELTARQVIAVAKSDLTIYEAHLQPAVDAAVRETEPARALDVTTVVPMDDQADHNLDPHIWLDPVRMITLASAVAEQLASIDPAHASDYLDNLKAVTASLHSLDNQYTTGLAICLRTEFITTHAAFGYLAERYGLTQIAISGLSPDAEPSPDRITQIHQIARDKSLTTVFFETLASPELAHTIAGDLNLATDQLDPIEGITDDSRGDDYPQVMLSNLSALRTANGCK